MVAKLRKWTIVAYPESDEGYLPRQEKTVLAPNWEAAMHIAWCTFPEYHEVGAFEEG